MVLEMLTGAALLAVGWLVGRFAPARRKGPKPPEPYCGCEHPLAFHDLAGGRCHAEVEIALERQSNGFVTRWQRQECPCRQYDGPTPLPMFYAPEVGA